MTGYEKLRAKHKTTLIIHIVAIIGFLSVFTMTKTGSIISMISLFLFFINLPFYKRYSKKFNHAEEIKMGTEQANKKQEEK